MVAHPTKQKATTTSKVAPDDILVDFAPEIRELANELRRIVREAVPAAEERAYPGWRAIGFRRPRCGYFAGIFPLDDRVKVAFEYGAHLTDPDELLEGDQKQVRYVVIRGLGDIRGEPLRRLLLTAIRFDRNTITKELWSLGAGCFGPFGERLAGGRCDELG